MSFHATACPKDRQDGSWLSTCAPAEAITQSIYRYTRLLFNQTGTVGFIHIFRKNIELFSYMSEQMSKRCRCEREDETYYPTFRAYLRWASFYSSKILQCSFMSIQPVSSNGAKHISLFKLNPYSNSWWWQFFVHNCCLEWHILCSILALWKLKETFYFPF